MRLKLFTAPTEEPIDLEVVKNHLKVDGIEDNVLITSLIKSARLTAENETKRAFITQTWRLYFDSVRAEIEIPKPPLQSIESIKTISSIETLVDETADKDQPVLKVALTTGFSPADTVIVNRDDTREENMTILSVQVDVSLTFTMNLTHVHTSAQADKVEKCVLVAASKYYVDASENSPGRVKLRSGSNWPIHRGFASFIIEFKAGYGDAGSDLPEGLLQGILVLIGHMYENRGDEEAKKAAIQEALKLYFYPYKILNI